MSQRILIVEDDDVLREVLKARLEAEGFGVMTAGDGEAALRVVAAETPAAVILDLSLPRLDGLAVCGRLRKDPATSRLPILILSARSEGIDKVVGLELGADDFMTKPYNPQELIARLRALLRRAALSAPARMMRAGAIELDLDRYSVAVEGREVRLTSKEYELLRALMEAGGRTLRREFLLEGVWGYERGAKVRSRTIDVHIRRLREKLGGEGTRIVTVRNVGYRLDASAESMKVGSGKQGERI